MENFFKLYNGIKAVEGMIFESGFDPEIVRITTTALYTKRKEMARFALQLRVITPEQYEALHL